MSKHRDGGYFPGLIMGALIGAGIYHYLNSTKDGKKVKEQLKKKGQEAIDQLVDTVSDLEAKGDEFKKKAKKLQVELEKKAKKKEKGLANEAKQQLDKIEKLRERGQMVAKQFFTKNGKSLAKTK